jgi:hypothetical protein
LPRTKRQAYYLRQLLTSHQPLNGWKIINKRGDGMKKPKLSGSYHHQGWVILWKEDESMFDNGFYETLNEAKATLPGDVMWKGQVVSDLYGKLIIRKAQLAFY